MPTQKYRSFEHSRAVEWGGRYPDQGVPLLERKIYQVLSKFYRWGTDTHSWGAGRRSDILGGAIDLSGGRRGHFRGQ